MSIAPYIYIYIHLYDVATWDSCIWTADSLTLRALHRHRRGQASHPVQASFVTTYRRSVKYSRIIHFQTCIKLNFSLPSYLSLIYQWDGWQLLPLLQREVLLGCHDLQFLRVAFTSQLAVNSWNSWMFKAPNLSLLHVPTRLSTIHYCIIRTNMQQLIPGLQRHRNEETATLLQHCLLHL